MQVSSEKLNLSSIPQTADTLITHGECLEYGRAQDVVVGHKADQVPITFCKFCMSYNSGKLTYLYISFPQPPLSNIVIDGPRSTCQNFHQNREK